MITDDMLSAAAQEVALCMESGICDVPHTFSQGFERKIGRLTRRANHPVLYRVTRSVVAAVLVLVMVFGSLMAILYIFRQNIGYVAGRETQNQRQRQQKGKQFFHRLPHRQLRKNAQASSLQRTASGSRMLTWNT